MQNIFFFFWAHGRHCSIFAKHINVNSLSPYLGLRDMWGPFWGFQGGSYCLCGQERARKIHISLGALGLCSASMRPAHQRLCLGTPSSPLCYGNQRQDRHLLPQVCQEQPSPQLCNLLHIMEFELTHPHNWSASEHFKLKFSIDFLHPRNFS